MAMGEGNELVLPAVQEQYRDGDVGYLESPRADQEVAVVPPSLAAGREPRGWCGLCSRPVHLSGRRRLLPTASSWRHAPSGKRTSRSATYSPRLGKDRVQVGTGNGNHLAAAGAHSSKETAAAQIRAFAWAAPRWIRLPPRRAAEPHRTTRISRPRPTRSGSASSVRQVNGTEDQQLHSDDLESGSGYGPDLGLHVGPGDGIRSLIGHVAGTVRRGTLPGLSSTITV